MHHRTTYKYISFQKTQVSRSVQTVLTIIFANNCKLQKFATTNSYFKKNGFPDTHYPITYVYINFQPNRVSRSVKNVHTNLFAKKSQVA